MEWAGAFGDLGTMIPFVFGYIAVVGMDPFGVLLALGLAMVASGAYYRTPMPVQPMKAIAAIAITQAAQTVVVTPAVIVAASLATGAIWLVLGLTGAAARLAGLVPAAVATGIVLGLGLGFMAGGLRMMASHWAIAAAGLSGTVLLLRSRRMPAMFALLLFGLASGALLEPGTVDAIVERPMALRAPAIVLDELSWDALLAGTLLLALPQLPLTLGNAIIAIRNENNRLFPDRPVSERRVAISTGLINLASAAIGGIPMCHGAGGMAGHVAFGARTGGALIIVGSSLAILAVCFSASVEALFRLFPVALLGVMLFLAGGQLTIGCRPFDNRWPDRIVTLLTAGFAIWNVGAAFVVGLVAAGLIRRLQARS
ncbi:MAG: putative sulfate/molybdate transporter [Rhodocyclaceae bacterium]|nr:putative sulfate/molybdate transporter [Rhodocyclaceae bacterium]